MILFERDISELREYENNPRVISDDAVDKMVAIIDEYGFRVPVIAKKDGLIVDGHLRYLAAKKLGLKSVPCLSADDMTEAQIKGFRIAVNKASEFAEWDEELLAIELQGLEDFDFDAELSGFDSVEIDELVEKDELFDSYDSSLAVKGALSFEFGVPPFTVLDTRKGEWINRKKTWRELIKDEGESREGTLYPKGSIMGNMNNGVSILDPVLAELMVLWFGMKGGVAFDCFAGDSVFGFVSSTLGMRFKGIELREEQALLNQRRCDEKELDAVYYTDSSENMDDYIKDDSVDLLFTCPPYADLEVYSENPSDLSNMSHEDFFLTYGKILKNSFRKLRDNRFAVIVVGEVRGKSGGYIGLITKTINSMEQAGYVFYNEIILVNSCGTLPLRAGISMRSTRKLGKTHQNILVFLKGDAKKAVSDLGEISGIKDIENE